MLATITQVGWPVGIQIVGRHRDDHSVLWLTYVFELVTGTVQRLPPTLDEHASCQSRLVKNLVCSCGDLCLEVAFLRGFGLNGMPTKGARNVASCDCRRTASLFTRLYIV